MTISANINLEMERQNLDRAKLGRLVGSNPTLIYDIVSGKSKSPKISTLQKIADALGVTLISLLQPPESAEIDREIKRVLSQMPSDDRKRLLLTANAWVQENSDK